MFSSYKNIRREISDYLNSDKRINDHLIGCGAVAELEHKIAKLYGATHVVCTSSGTAALLATALAIGLKDSQFITPPLAYGASLASWLMLGNRPVFVDVDPQTLTLDPLRVAEKITPETKAILAIDTFGTPCDSAALRKVADEFGIFYASDSCQALGATRGGSPASHDADAIAISFTVGKTISCGEGGAVITNDSKLYGLLLRFSQHPLRQKREIGLREFNEFAFNARIHPLGAIWANAAFEGSLTELRHRQSRYQEAISALNESGLIEPINFEAADIRPSFFRLTAELTENVPVAEVVEYLASRDIEARASAMRLDVIYKNRTFLEQYGDRYRLPEWCHIAERAAENRIVLTLID